MATNKVEFPFEYFPDPISGGKSLFNADIYVGVANTDPEIPANQKPITVREPDGTETVISQPLKTGSGGVPTFNGSSVDAFVDGSYSVKVLDRLGNQQYYSADVTKGVALTKDTVGEPSGYVFKNISDLKEGTLVNGDTVNVEEGITVSTQGYYASGDGGGAKYLIASSQSVDEFGDHTLDSGSVALIQGGEITTYQYGCVGDGLNDDTSNLQAAIDAAASKSIKLLAYGSMRSTKTLIFSASNLQVEFIANAEIVPDSSVLVGATFGTNAGGSNIPTRMNLSRIKVNRASLDLGTENIGIEFLAFNQSSINDPEARNNKYSYKAQPESGGFAYNNINNLQAINHVRGLWMVEAGSGFSNENKFFGGRYFDGGSMEYQIYLDGNQVNNNHFYGASIEGSGVSGIFCNGFQNLFIQPRLEGTWSTAQVEFGVDSLLNFLIDNSLYVTTIVDNTTNPTGNRWMTGRSGDLEVLSIGATQNVIKRTNVSGDVAVKQIEDLATSGNSYCLELRHNRDNATSYSFKSVRDSDGLVRSSLTTDGRLTVARQLINEQSSFSFEPLVLGAYYFWVDSTGRLRIKNGAPTSAEDGTVVGTQT